MGLASLSVIVGLLVLALGGEIVVRTAGNVAAALGMSRLVIGLTVVAFATSTPELIVTLEAVFAGRPGLAVGNVVGSNIANVLLVLGIAAAITRLTVRSRALRLDIPIMIGFSVVAVLMAWNGQLASWQGAVLVLLLAGYVLIAVKSERHHRQSPGSREPDRPTVPERRARFVTVNLLLLLAAVAALLVGAAVLISGATELAAAWGLSDIVIGLTIVAVGTSAPEIATAIVASLRGARDLAVGNAVGSNIFNIGAVLGLGAALAPGGIPVAQSAHLDLVLMTVVAIALYPIARTGKVINRWEGWAFLGYYAAFVTFLLLAATDPAARDAFAIIMLAVIIPVTIIIASLAYWRGYRGHDNQQQPTPG